MNAKKLTTFFLAFIALAAISGCSIYHLDSDDTATDLYPPKKSPQDVVYLQEVSQPHEIIG